MSSCRTATADLTVSILIIVWMMPADRSRNVVYQSVH
jgi:hypothetical protein